MGLLDDIKSDVKKVGTNKGKIMYFKEGTKVRIRFLTDFEDGMAVPFHDSYAEGINLPCQTVFGRDCEYCGEDGLRTRNQYIWSVYDIEAKEVKLLMFPVNSCSPVIQLSSFYEEYGTMLDRDYVIQKKGTGTNTTYSVIPQDKSKFRNAKVKALSESAILKILDKAFPNDNSEDEDEDEEETTVKKKGKANTNKGSKSKKNYEPEPEEDEEDDWDEDEEESTDYEDMTPQELYKLCKERGIRVKPKMKKDYYIEILEDADESEDDEDEEGDWD